jgi:NitT/TauT family transport system substrate-binding protein
MNLFSRMGWLPKYVVLPAIVILIGFFGWKYINKHTNLGGGSDLKIGLNAFSGAAGLPYINGGMITTKDSRMATEFKLNVEIKQIDIRNDAINALKNDEVDLIWCTTDVFPIEMGANSDFTTLNVQQIAQTNISRGADVLVAIDKIKSVAEGRGKRWCYGKGTASQTLVLKVLEAAGMTIKDIVPIEVSDGIQAKKVFINGGCDVAAVWSPDDGDALAAVPGSWRLASTAQARSIICDGLIVKKSVLDKKFDDIVKLCTAWFVANAELNTSEKAQQDAAAIFTKSFTGTDAVVVLDGIKKVRFATYGDNLGFFGIDPSFTGVTGDQLYTNMSRMYSDIGIAQGPLPWISVSNPSVINAIKNLTDQTQAKEGQYKFTEPTTAIENMPATATKRVTINFAVNSAELDEYNKSVIDREIGMLTKSFSGARVRIEGNTDVTGNNSINIPLSQTRARSVANYLIDKYKFDSKRFIVKGNGSNKPLCRDNTDACNTLNRRTDVDFIFE